MWTSIDGTSARKNILGNATTLATVQRKQKKKIKDVERGGKMM
jgi:hypothetical protein